MSEEIFKPKTFDELERYVRDAFEMIPAGWCAKYQRSKQSYYNTRRNAERLMRKVQKAREAALAFEERIGL